MTTAETVLLIGAVTWSVTLSRLSSRGPFCREPSGLEDQVIEHKQTRDLHQALSRSDLHLVLNAGHMVTHADPAAMMEAINSMIAS